MIGKTISHYRIIGELGRGGMGEVYLAEDLSLERRVAIKILTRHLTGDRDAVDRFKREAKAAASLNHPGIVTIHEIIETDGHLCMVMEYIAGKTLREELADNGPLPAAVCFNIIEQITSGLSAAHSAGIVHRDIKPENILIDNNRRVKILDFGLAKLKGSGNLTKEASTLGTIYYMSPEQTRGEPVDQRSDIWSLGVVIYEILTGRKPFMGDYDQAVVYAILNEEIPDLAELSEPAASIVNKSLKKKPEERFQDIDGLLQNLKTGDAEKQKVPIAKKTGIRSTKSILAASFAVLVFILTLYILFPAKRSDPEPGDHWQHSIAVLPFDDLSPDRDQDYFCVGMTEQILSNLSRFRQLRVIARTSVMKYQHAQKSIAEIGKELNVQNILSGSVQRTREKVRITVQLINAVSGTYLWSQKYDGDMQDLFTIQDEVSEKVADQLNVTFKPSPSFGVKDTTTNREAYEYCLKGEYLSRYGIIDKALSEHERLFHLSEDHFKRSLQLDPSFTRAKLGLAELYLSYLFLHGDEQRLAQVLQFSDEALAADPDNDFALTLKGGYYFEMVDGYQATKYFRQALQINPNAARAYYYLGQFYNSKGLYHQAEEYFVKAVQIDPLNTFYLFQCGVTFLNLARFDEAEVYFRKLLEFNPDHVLGRWSLTLLNLYRGRYAAADSLFKEHLKLFPDFDLNFYAESRLAAAEGDTEKALSLEESPEIYLLLNRKEEAIDLLQKALAGPDSVQYSYLTLINYPLYLPIRQDPRFMQIVQKKKGQYENNLQKYVGLSEKLTE